MTAYNREKYIAFAIESVLASTYQNWELIIVDDASTDNTVAISKKHEISDSRIRVYVNDENLGDYPNRNKAASYAKGKYLKYLDADDLIYPNGLEILVNNMEKHPNAGFGLCSLKQEKDQIYPILMSPKDAFRKNYFESSIFHKAPLSSIIKNDVFVSVEGFSGKQHLGDFELWHNLASLYPVLLMQDGIVWAREHDDQQMNDNLADPFVPFKYILMAKDFVENEKSPLSINENQMILKKLKLSESISILSCFKRYPYSKTKQLLKASNMNLLTSFFYYLINR